MSGKAAIVHRNYLHTWLIKFFCKPREVEDHKEIIQPWILDNASHHFVIFQDKMDKEAKRTSLVGEGATHQERTLYWILGKFFSNYLPASCSITHKRVDTENIGFLHRSIDLDTLIEQACHAGGVAILSALARPAGGLGGIMA